MFLFQGCRSSGTAIILLLCFLVSPCLQAQSPSHYEPSLESLDKHPLPQWYADAKVGIFIHWGLYSVPGWAPLIHPEHHFTGLHHTQPLCRMVFEQHAARGSTDEGLPSRALWR